jgi:type II secretory pathway component GspD/PulD (secretin)
MIALDGGDKAIVKQGGKMPIVTGTTDAGNSAQNSQVQYIDIGLTIEATVEGSASALRLRTKVEQSSVADQRAASSVQDPTFRQTGLEAMAALVPGKPLVLGSLDIPGTTRREEVSVVSELVH